MINARTRLIIAAGFFLFWLAVLYAGADHPPPPGFLLIVLFDLLAAAGVYHRIAVYAAWAAARRPHRLWRVLAEGVAAGLVLGLLALLLPGGGEPAVSPSAWYEDAIFFIVMAGVGMVNALGIYFLSYLAYRAARKAQ